MIIQINFPLRKMPNGENIICRIRFNSNQSSIYPVVNVYAADFGLELTEIGEIECSYDSNKFAMAHSNVNLKFTDTKGLLKNYLYTDPNVDPRGEVSLLKIKSEIKGTYTDNLPAPTYYGSITIGKIPDNEQMPVLEGDYIYLNGDCRKVVKTLNSYNETEVDSHWRERFNVNATAYICEQFLTGFIIEDTIDVEEETGDYPCSFTIIPALGKINQTLISASGLPEGFINIRELLYLIYKFENPSLKEYEVIISHDFKFAGGFSALKTVCNIPFHSLCIDVYDYAEKRGVLTLGEFIKALAVDFFAVTGINQQGKPFFKSLNNYQSFLGTFQVKKSDVIKRSYLYPDKIMDWVSVSLADGSITPDPLKHTEGINIEDGNVGIEIKMGLYIRVDILNVSNVTFHPTAGNIPITMVYNDEGNGDPTLISSYIGIQNYIAKKWYNFRCLKRNNHRLKMTLNNTKVNFENVVSDYERKTHSVTKIVKNLMEDTTEIELFMTKEN